MLKIPRFAAVSNLMNPRVTPTIFMKPVLQKYLFSYGFPRWTSGDGRRGLCFTSPKQAQVNPQTNPNILREGPAPCPANLFWGHQTPIFVVLRILDLPPFCSGKAFDFIFEQCSLKARVRRPRFLQKKKLYSRVWGPFLSFKSEVLFFVGLVRDPKRICL